jgi:hypothetical protein
VSRYRGGHPGRRDSRRALTLAQERELLRDARALVEVDPELRGSLRFANLPATEAGRRAHRDQVLAATKHAEKLVRATGTRLGLPREFQIRPRTALAELVAGLLRSLAQNRCRHALAFRSPFTVYLNARVATCDACWPRFIKHFAAADARVRAGDAICDFCLAESRDNQFTLMHVNVGPAMLLGDACCSCMETFGADEVRAAA